MGLHTIRGEVVYDIGLTSLDVKMTSLYFEEHIFWADGCIYMIRETDAESAFKVNGRYIDVGLVWNICENNGLMTLDMIITREILPLDCSSEVRQRAQADGNKLVRKLATIGKSHHDDKKKIKIDLSELPQSYKNLYDHAFPCGIDLDVERSVRIYDYLNMCKTDQEFMVYNGEKTDDENEGEVIDK